MRGDKGERTAPEANGEKRSDEGDKNLGYDANRRDHAISNTRDRTQTGYAWDEQAKNGSVPRSRWDDRQPRSSKDYSKDSSSKSHSRLRAWSPSEDNHRVNHSRKIDDKLDRNDSRRHHHHERDRSRHEENHCSRDSSRPNDSSRQDKSRASDDHYRRKSYHHGVDSKISDHERESRRDYYRHGEENLDRGETKVGEPSVAGSSRTEQSVSRGRSPTRQDSRSPTRSSSSSTTRTSEDEKSRSSKKRRRDDTPRSPSRGGHDHRRDHGSSHGKRKHRSSSRDRDRKKRRHKDKHGDRHREERRSVLTGKKIKLKVKKDREDHERDANRQDLLQFLNSTL